MSAKTKSSDKPLLSIVHGRPLSEEPGQGAHTIAGYLREVTKRYAEREALVLHTPEGAVRWSYTDLWERSVEIARALIACGVRKDSRVGVLMTNRPEFVAAVFGTAMAGGVTVALNTFSTPVELEYLLKASCVSTLLFERHVAKKDFAEILTELERAIKTAAPGKIVSSKFPFLSLIAAIDPRQEKASGRIEPWAGFLRRGEAVSRERVEARTATATPADLGVLFFSSGSTGLPKGILHSQRAAAVQWQRFPRILCMESPVRNWTANGFFWSGNFTMTIGTALSTGGTMVLQRTFDAEEALALMEKERVSAPFASKHQWARMEEAPNYDATDLSSIRYANYHLMSSRHETMKELIASPNAFGTTETLAINTSGTEAPPGEQSLEGYGLPLPGNSLKIVDPETGEIVSRGERGEIAIKGPTLMMGYLGKTPDECFDEEGYYRTGDGGYVDEKGWLFWEGRLSDIIKTGGANVSPVEIDLAIRTYPGVKESQTIGIPHETLGEIVVACIVPQYGAVIDEAGLRDFLKERLASYKAPRRFLFLREDDLAMTGSAKVKAGKLRELVAGRFSAEAQNEKA